MTAIARQSRVSQRHCAVKGCPHPPSARGWCRTHYEQWRRRGDPLAPDARILRDGTRRWDRSYVRTKLAGHPLAWNSGWVHEHRAVLWAKIGPGTHACHWCGKPVRWGGPRQGREGKPTALIADHLDGFALNNAPENLVPSCFSCNLTRRTPRVCGQCGSSLEGRRRHARFCSATCRGRAARGELVPSPRRCRGCKRPIAGRRADAVWCSERCRARFRARKRAKAGTEPSAAAQIPDPARRRLDRQPVELEAAAA